MGNFLFHHLVTLIGEDTMTLTRREHEVFPDDRARLPARLRWGILDLPVNNQSSEELVKNLVLNDKTLLTYV